MEPIISLQCAGIIVFDSQPAGTSDQIYWVPHRWTYLILFEGKKEEKQHSCEGRTGT
jgi:hypothetical protein